MEKLLVQLGFHKNEIAVYLALFELGKVRAKEIIAYTKLHRNLVYTALDALVARDLVTKTIVSGVAEFVANNPKSLVAEIEEKKRIATTLAEELEKKQLETPREVSVHEGAQALQHMREKLLDDADGEEVYIFGASPQTSTPEWEHFWQGYHRRRVKREIPLKIFYTKDSTVDLLDWRNTLPITEAKYLPFDAEFPAWFGGAGDHFQVSIPGDNPLTFYIKSREAVLGFRAFFDYFWHQKASSETGYESVFRAWDYMLDSLEPGETYAVLGANFGRLNRQHNEYLEKFHLRRIQKGVVVNMITSKDSFVPIRDRFIRAGDPDLRLSTIKPFPSDVEQPFQINIFKGKTYIFIFSDEPTVIKFDDPEMALGFQSYFDALWNQDVATRTGMDGARVSFEEILQTLSAGDELLVMGIFDFDPQFANFIQKFHAQRAKRGITARILLNDHAKDIGTALGGIANTKIKYMQQGEVTPAIFLMYGDKTLISLPGERTFITIHQPLATASFRTHFETNWNQESYVLTGAEAVRDLWLESIEVGELNFIAARGYFVDKYPKLFKEVTTKAIQTTGLKWKIINDPSTKGHPLTQLPWVENRYVLPDVPNPNVVWIFGNKVAIANWTEDNPVVFVSTNQNLVQSYRDYFEAMWQQPELI